MPLLKIIEVKSEEKLSKFRIDNDKKFINEAFDKFYKKRGIIFEFTSPYILKQNLLIERTWRTFSKSKDSIFNKYDLSRNFWAEVIIVANYFRNRLLIVGRNKISEELQISIILNVNYLKIFGYIIYNYIPKENRQKSFIEKFWKGIFIGYIKTIKQFKIWNFD